MTNSTKWLILLLVALFGLLTLNSKNIIAANGVTLYTPYTKISVPPGESIDYSIDVINNTNELQNVEISVGGMPKGWNYILKSGGWNIGQLSILQGERKNISLRVEVPLQVNKGSYKFNVVAGGHSTLSLVVVVSEQGTFKTEFTTKQANMEGHVNSTFTYTADLKNRTADKQLYALMAQAPPGWNVTFKANYKQVTSVEIEPNNTASVTVEINPPALIETGKYKIPVRATTNATSANLELEAVITGSYSMELTTPTGLLSTNITAGDKKRVELLIKNTGSSELKDINFSYTGPANWEVTFEPNKVPLLGAGGSTHVYATIKAFKKAIPGDYVTDITAKTPEVTSKTTFRISLETPMLWGWIGILIIIIAVGSVYYLFRKYGRR